MGSEWGEIGGTERTTRGMYCSSKDGIPETCVRRKYLSRRGSKSANYWRVVSQDEFTVSNGVYRRV